MIVSLIGMSNVGKSLWSHRLEECGFIRFSCDDFILKELVKQGILQNASDLTALARWLGFPGDPQYKTASQRYLELEEQSLAFILDYIESHQEALSSTNLVIDTTGSVIYTSPSIQQRLHALTEIVYLFRSDQSLDEKFELFMKEPKPIIWGNSFHKKDTQDMHKALKKSYQDLLQYRTQKYVDLAHKTITLTEQKHRHWHIKDFIRSIYTL